MTDENLVAWGHFILEILTALGGLIGTIAGLGALLARRTFASKEDLERRFAVHDGVHNELAQRMADGETRFARLSGAIEMVKAAADQAKDAANDARDAADQAKEASVEIAEMKGSIRSIERLTMTMVEGHMAGGLNRRGVHD